MGARWISMLVLTTFNFSVTEPAAASGGPQADLSITKTDNQCCITAGEATTYTIVVANAGPAAVAGATVTDVFPTPLTCSWSCTPSPGASCTPGPVAGDLVDSVSLPTGGSATYAADCSLDPEAAGFLDNTASITSGLPDPDPTDNSASDLDSILRVADVSMTKTDGLVYATPGQPITYTLVGANAGPSTAEATAYDPFPAELEDPTWTCVASPGAICHDGTGDVVDFVLLPPGGTVTYTVHATIDSEFTGLLSNGARIDLPLSPGPPAEITDPDLSNNVDFDETTVVAGPLSIPTLSPAGLGALVLLLTGAALVALARRRRTSR